MKKEMKERRAKIEEARETLKLKFWPVANVRKRLVSCYQAELFVPDGVDLDDDRIVGLPGLEIDLEARGILVGVDLESPFKPAAFVAGRDPSMRLRDLRPVANAEDRR